MTLGDAGVDERVKKSTSKRKRKNAQKDDAEVTQNPRQIDSCSVAHHAQMSAERLLAPLHDLELRKSRLEPRVAFCRDLRAESAERQAA